jgi:hypothetical protein
MPACLCSKVVWLLSLLDDWATTEVTAPLVTHWAGTMAWLAGNTHGSFSLQVCSALRGHQDEGHAQFTRLIVPHLIPEQ